MALQFHGELKQADHISTQTIAAQIFQQLLETKDVNSACDGASNSTILCPLIKPTTPVIPCKSVTVSYMALGLHGELK